MADSGLMSEVLSSLQTELFATLKGVELRSEKANLQETGEHLQSGLSNHWTVKRIVKLRKRLSVQAPLAKSVLMSEFIDIDFSIFTY